MIARRIAIALSFWLLCGGAAFAQSTKAPPVQLGQQLESHALPIVRVPITRAHEGLAMWDSLAAYEFRDAWAASESLSVLLMDRISASTPVDSLEYSHALLYYANSFVQRRLHSEGRSLGNLERALGIRERLADPLDPLTIWGHAVAAHFYIEAGDANRAREHGLIAIERLNAREPLDEAMLAQARLSLANACTALRQWDEARTHYESALELRDRLYGPDSLNQVPLLAEYATLLGRLGEFDAARPLLRRAVRLCEASLAPGQSSDFLEQSLSRFASLENRAGNTAASLDLAMRAYGLSRGRIGEDAISTVRLRTIVAYRLLDLGDDAGGAAHLREIVPAMEKGMGEKHPQTLNARLALLEAMAAIGDTGDADAQLSLARDALTGRDRVADNNWVYLLQITGELELARGRTQVARDSLWTAVELVQRREDPVGDVLADLLVRLYDSARSEQDREFVAKVDEVTVRLEATSQVRGTLSWPAMVAAQAAAEGRVGSYDLAWERALLAEELLRTRLRYEVEALPDRSALMLADRLGQASELLLAAMRPERAQELYTAWDRLVRWRGHVRHEVERRRLPRGIEVADDLRAAHERWMAAQRKLGQLVVSGAAHPNDPDSRERFESARDDAQELERRYALSLKAKLPPQEPPALDALLAALDADEALVAFAVRSFGEDDARLGAFVARGGARELRWIEFGPRAKIERELSQWYASLASPTAGDARRAEAECRRLGERVRERLWDPIARATKGRSQLLVVPEGMIAQLPWQALPVAGNRYLVESESVVRVLAAERELLSRPSEEGRGLFALGGPDFDGDAAGPSTIEVASAEPSRAWRCYGAESLELEPLPAAQREAEALSAAWPRTAGPAKLLLARDASEARFKSEAPGHAVVHLATHGIVIDKDCAATATSGMRGVGGVSVVAPGRHPSNPFFGRQVWLALAGANHASEHDHDENEGLLTAEEVVTLDLRGTEWVVLSACQSAAATEWGREGVVGMQRSFHLAGARSVIASHWSVGDESTREWMQALYAARAPDRPAGFAVASACRQILSARRASGRPTHPFHWAAFAASGE